MHFYEAIVDIHRFCRVPRSDIAMIKLLRLNAKPSLQRTILTYETQNLRISSRSVKNVIRLSSLTYTDPIPRINQPVILLKFQIKMRALNMLMKL